MSSSPSQTHPAFALRQETPEGRRETIRSARWALVIACAYLVLFSDQSAGTIGLGGIVIALFLASNLILGRIPAEMVGTPQFNVSLALMDAVFIGASLYFAGQLSVELVVLCLGVLVLAIAGLGPGAMAIGTVTLAACYLLIVWAVGSEPLLRSEILLRAPFLLSAAIVYAWLVELGRHNQSKSAAAAAVLRDLETTLAVQRDAIERCQQALAQGSNGPVQSALNEIAAENQDMASLLARAASRSHAEDAGQHSPAVAHSPA